MLKIAIIGTGNISSAHIEAYLAYPEKAQITALCDIYPEKAENRKRQYALNDALIYDDHLKLLEAGPYDLISICTPPYTHAEIAINCMKAGSNILIEKPMASSLEECDRIRAVERETGRTASSVAQNRFREEMMTLKQVLDSGLAGRILHAQVDSFWWRGHNYYDLWWRGTWAQEGGGCTLNHAVHHVDLLNWMMGTLPQQVTSVISNLAHDNSETEDLSVSILSYDGALATLTGSVVHHGEDQKLIFQCEKARVAAPEATFGSKTRDNGFPERDTKLEKRIEDLGRVKLGHEGHVAQIGDVLEAIEVGRQPFITTADGRNTIELITAIYKSGSTGQAVSLPIQPEDPWYTVNGILENARHFHEKKGSVTELGSSDISVGGKK